LRPTYCCRKQWPRPPLSTFDFAFTSTSRWKTWFFSSPFPSPPTYFVVQIYLIIMLSRTMKAAGMSSLALVGLIMPTPSVAQFGVPGNRRPKGAASFEELNKMAAERMTAEEKGGGAVGGLEDLMGDMDIGELMKNMDPNTLQELVQEGMKDPAIKEMVSDFLQFPLNTYLLGVKSFNSLFNKQSSLECKGQWTNYLTWTQISSKNKWKVPCQCSPPWICNKI
ncbi:hypothetical protein ACHAWF_004020, partial [Thalassiosira exigua]